jgi:hypothetical protein
MKTDTKGLLTVFGVIKRPEFEKKKSLNEDDCYVISCSLVFWGTLLITVLWYTAVFLNDVFNVHEKSMISLTIN